MLSTATSWEERGRQTPARREMYPEPVNAQEGGVNSPARCALADRGLQLSLGSVLNIRYGKRPQKSPPVHFSLQLPKLGLAFPCLTGDLFVLLVRRDSLRRYCAGAKRLC